MALYLTVLIAVLNQISLKGSKMLIALHAIELKAGPLTIGFLVSMYAVFPLMLAMFAGRVTDRAGVRWPMLLGSAGTALGLLLPFLWPAMPALFLSAAVLGATNIFFHVSAHALIGSFGDQQSRTKNFATFSLGAAVSGAIGPALAGFLIDTVGYSGTFAALAAIALVPTIVLLCYSAFIPNKIHVKADPQARGVKELLANRALRTTIITSGLIITAIDLFSFYMPIYGRMIALQASTIGWIISMHAVAAFLVRLWMPRLAKHYGEARVLTWSLIVSGCTYFLFPLFTEPLVLAAISFLLGLGLGCGQPLSIVLTYNYSPLGRSGEALGLRLTVNKFTQITVPLVFGSIGAAFGVFPVFWSNGIFLLVGGFFIRKQHKEHP